MELEGTPRHYVSKFEIHITLLHTDGGGLAEIRSDYRVPFYRAIEKDTRPVETEMLGGDGLRGAV